MAGKPSDPSKPKQTRKLGPKKLFIMVDRTKFAEGVDPKTAILGVHTNPNDALDAADTNPGVTFVRFTVPTRARSAS